MPYKISGNMSEDCNIKVFQGDDYIGYREATGSSHNTVFDLTSSGVVTAVAENSNGRIVGYGNVLPTSTGDSVNITSAGGGLVIGSIQRGVITIPAPDTSTTVAISEVDLSKAVISVVGHGGAVSGSTRVPRCLLSFTDSTHIKADRYGNPGFTTWVGYEVIEFSSGIASLQYKTITIGSADTTETTAIDEVDLSKTVLYYAGGHGTHGRAERWQGRVTLDDSTTLRATCAGTWDGSVAYHAAFVLESV